MAQKNNRKVGGGGGVLSFGMWIHGGEGGFIYFLRGGGGGVSKEGLQSKHPRW